MVVSPFLDYGICEQSALSFRYIIVHSFDPRQKRRRKVRSCSRKDEATGLCSRTGWRTNYGKPPLCKGRWHGLP